MKQTEKFMLAKSLAGHDKDKIYIIFMAEGEYVYLVDGKTKLLSAPKKKNRKHIQIIKQIPAVLLDQINNKKEIRNEHIKRAIKDYLSRSGNTGNPV